MFCNERQETCAKPTHSAWPRLLSAPRRTADRQCGVTS